MMNMASLIFSTSTMLTLAFSHSVQAAYPHLILPRAMAAAASPNITYGICYPADTSGGLPVLSKPDCTFALQQFLQAHNETADAEVILTNDATKSADPSPENPYIQNGGAFFPSDEPVGPRDVQCQLVYSIGDDADPSRDAADTPISLSDFEMATNEIIANCTGTALGGEVAVANAEGQQIYINVERAPHE